ncbi:MAG: serine/threonine-protein kinase [Kofleriaceae bacterium]
MEPVAISRSHDLLHDRVSTHFPAVHRVAGYPRVRPYGSILADLRTFGDLRSGMNDARRGIVDNYEVGRLLGRGGMGEVHIARDRSGRFVAIKKVRKTLSLDPVLCERLTLEADLLRRIDHPNVVRVLDGGVANGQPFMVMSRAFGTPLDAVLAVASPMSRERITGITSQLFDGLIAIHAAGVIHADLKSSNILIDELDRVTIIDFGLARVAHDPLGDDEIFGGTPAYMAPELLAGGTPTAASDIYAAGVVLYELLAGSSPLPRSLPAVVMMSRRMHEPVELPSRRAPERAITAALDAVVARALATNAIDRFTTVRDLADALADALAAWIPAAEDRPTREWARPPSAQHVAPTLRRPIATDAPETIIQQGLASASELVAARDVTSAIATLEDALARLAPREPTLTMVPAAWRLETVLAALYQSLGKRDHANRIARFAFQHARDAKDPVAIARTTGLLSQLASGQTRIARGSRQAIRARPATR